MRAGIGGATAILFPLTVLLASFPIAGLLQRGNIELFLWIVTATGVWMFVRGRDDAAAVLWGLAAALKLYPVVLLALLLPRKTHVSESRRGAPKTWRAFTSPRSAKGRAFCLSLPLDYPGGTVNPPPPAAAETGLISGAVVYQPDPVEPPADGNLLICCSQPQGDIALDL